MPSVASGLLAPNVIAHDVEPVAESVHRPAMLTGGGLAAGPAGAALAAGGLSDPLSVMRSLPPQAASNHAQAMTGRVRRRQAMVDGIGKMNSQLWLAECCCRVSEAALT